jgi:hypothetical protein
VVEADFDIGLVACAGLVLVCAVVLDLFTVILDFGQAKCCATTLEEVTEGAELGEILLFAVGNRVSLCLYIFTPPMDWETQKLRTCSRPSCQMCCRLAGRSQRQCSC